MKRPILLCAILAATGLLFVSAAAFAQDFRGAINGTVTDATGAVLPGVTVTVTNVETNVPNVVVTDSKGAYQVKYLNSGTYSAEARLEGFKPVIRRGVQVRVGDVITSDFKLEPGGMAEAITVVATTPLLDTSTAVSGQVIDSKQIERLPLGDGTAYMLTRLAPGVMDSSDLHFARPADNGNLAGIVANGAQGGNEFTLDGAPNRVSPNNSQSGNNNGVVGFSPPSDAIAEFKVQTNSFDAQQGHTAGATVNLALKSGTNSFKGTAAYFNRSDARTATPLLTKRAGAEKPTRQYGRYTGTFSGPIIRDRTFFMMAFERLHDVQPEPSSYTVPTLKMRAGDLSEFTGVTIYNPFTATGSNNARTAFTGNQVPNNMINPVARAYMALYPEPNRPGLSGNYFTNMLRPYDYNGYLTRLDHSLGPSDRLFLTAYYNKRQEDRYNWALGAPNAADGVIGGFAVTHGYDYRSNTGATLGYTVIRSSNLVFDVRGAWSRFGEWRKPADTFDPASLGFSSAAAALMKGYDYLPFITFGGFSTTNANSRIATLGSQRSDFGTGFNRPFRNLTFTPNADWLLGGHALRAGYELRHQRWQINVPAYGAGRYNFNGAYTRLNNSAPLNDQAQEWAQFLLGLPTTGTGTVANAGSTSSQFEIAAEGDYSQITHALYFQDDWHFNPRLTVNLGVRFEMEGAMTEANDRNISGFDRNLDSPIAAAAMANYAKNPINEIPVNAFQVRGGLRFAQGSIYNNLNKVLPRAGAEYQLGQKTVLRGGLGLFSYDYYFDAGNQIGYSQPTAIVTTEDNGKTFLTDLTNPIPSGQLIQPPGSSLGAATGLGLNIGTSSAAIVPADRKVPYYTRWQIGAQHDFGAGFVAEVTYVDSHGTHLPVQRDINALPMQYLSTSRTRDTTQESFLSGSVPNPFAGMMPGTGINGSTVSRSQLLRPYPQFGTIFMEEYTGSDRYKAGSLRVEKRFSGHNSILVQYTRSKTTDKLNFLNGTDGVLEDRISPNDRPNRASIGGTIDLPFGAGHYWGSDWKGLAEAALGGWSVSATYQYQSGFPLLWSNNIYYDPNRNPKDLHSHIGKHTDCGVAGLDCPAWDTSGFYIAGGTGRTDSRIQLGNNVRYFPSTLPNMRTDPLHLLDVGLYKTFSLPSHLSLQVRIEAINALNYTVLWNPNLDPRNANFGIVNQDRNNPRDIQLGGRLTF
ncbi:MAG TPA: TonB-dependent receptor [Thermoanaerobaculia bacterium]|nr:TonB-dependent receptor [Thermoanaerobaculia bacterium]